jgi:hypothetical protein
LPDTYVQAAAGTFQTHLAVFGRHDTIDIK